MKSAHITPTLVPAVRGLIALVLCGTVTSAPAALVTIDDYTSDTLSSEYQQSTVLDQGNSESYAFDTTTNDNQLTASIEGADAQEDARQDVLLRDDYSLGVGETLSVDVIGGSVGNTDDFFGLAIATAKGITQRSNMIQVVLKGDSDTSPSTSSLVRLETVNDAGDYGSFGAETSVDGLDGVNVLALRRNSTTEFEGLYDAGSGLVSLGTYDVGTEPAPGAAFGYVMGNGRESGPITAQVDNLRMNVIPEPTTLALLALGSVALLRRPRRR